MGEHSWASCDTFADNLPPSYNTTGNWELNSFHTQEMITYIMQTWDKTGKTSFSLHHENEFFVPIFFSVSHMITVREHFQYTFVAFLRRDQIRSFLHKKLGFICTEVNTIWHEKALLKLIRHLEISVKTRRVSGVLFWWLIEIACLSIFYTDLFQRSNMPYFTIVLAVFLHYFTFLGFI